MLRIALDPSDEPAASSPNPAPPRRFGDYQLLGEIARGGMGIVYRARQPDLNRIVALKVLIGGAYSSEALLRRFKLEAESAAGLQHPGIVTIHQFGEYEHQPYYTMDFVQGRNLSEICADHPLIPTRAARYLRAIAQAVHFAHQQGILHRDLKPSNVLIDENDCPRITDFGLAKRLNAFADMTLAGQLVGSPNYVPPEQLPGHNGEIGVTSDVYSLGALLYCLLTTRPPFLASTVEETLRLVATEEPVSPRALNPAVPRDLETICLKCLEKDPAQRYPSANSVVDELTRFETGQPIAARPVSSSEQLWRWSRHHPALTALAATVVVALTVTSTIFYAAAQRVERARALEQAARIEAEQSLYAANMEIAAGGIAAAAGIDRAGHFKYLNDARPQPGARDLRGFEWRHFWRIGQSDAMATLKGHTHVVDTAIFSRDGRHVATHSADGMLKVWDASTHALLRSRTDVANVGGFGPNNEELIFSGSDDSVWRWDFAGDKAERLIAATGQLLVVRPDGHAIVLGPGQRPRIQSLSKGEPVIGGGRLPPNSCFAASADGRRLALARPRMPIAVADLETQHEIAAIIDPRPITALALSLDGSRLASAGFDGVVKIWNVANGAIEKSFRGFLDPIWSLAFSADGNRLVGGGNNRYLRIWNTADWSLAQTALGHTSTVRAIAFSPDGHRLISGGEDELALIWTTDVRRTADEAPQLLRGPGWSDLTPSLAFSPDNEHFAGTAADGTIKIWRTDNFAVERSFPGEFRTVAYTADGRELLAEEIDGSVHRWSVDGFNQGKVAIPKKQISNWLVDPLTPEERVTQVSDQADPRARYGLCAITSTRDAMNAGAMLSASTIGMSPDGKTMFVGTARGDVEVWDVANRRLRMKFAAHKLGVSSLAVSPDGIYIATGSLDNCTKLWAAETGKTIATFRAHNRPVWALAFSRDGQTLAAGSCDKAIMLYSIPLRRKVGGLSLYVGLPKGFEQEVRVLQFSPDSNILAAGLGDGTVRFFRAASLSEADADHSKDYPADSM
jgi:WD40 repeat protein